MPEKQRSWRNPREETEGKGKDPEPDQNRDQKGPGLTIPIHQLSYFSYQSSTHRVSHLDGTLVVV